VSHHAFSALICFLVFMHRYFIRPHNVCIVSLLLLPLECGCFPFAPSFNYLCALSFLAAENFVLTFVFSQILCVVLCLVSMQLVWSLWLKLKKYEVSEC